MSENWIFKNANGVELNNGVIFYYQDQMDFFEAWPGIKLMLEVMNDNK